jgi:hypothetical protein
MGSRKVNECMCGVANEAACRTATASNLNHTNTKSTMASTLVLVLLLLQNTIFCTFAFQSQHRASRSLLSPFKGPFRLQARKNQGFYDDEENNGDEDYNDFDEPPSRRRVRRNSIDNLGDFDESTGLNLPSGFGRRAGWRLPDTLSKSILAGVFVLGVGLGVTVDSQVNTNPKDLASRDAIDVAAPNRYLCAKLGASAMAFDQRVFVSFNPFNVYVSHADVKPGCVLRQENVVSVLRERGLIDDAEVRACKNNMNTWAFVGNLGDSPQLSCVYKSQDAQNEFLSNPKLGIGEDYMDDDRENFRKQLKIGGTQAQQKAQAEKEAYLRQRVRDIPILDVNET